MRQIRFPARWSNMAVSILALLAGPLATAMFSEEFRLQIPQLAGDYAYGQSRGPVAFDLGSALSTVAVIRVEITGTFTMGWWDSDDVENYYHGPKGSLLYIQMNRDADFLHSLDGGVRFGTNGPFRLTITLGPFGPPTNYDFIRDGTSDLYVENSIDLMWGHMTVPSQVSISSLTVSIEAERVPERPSIRVSQVELCWDTTTNAWYQLQYRSILTTNQWAPLSMWFPGNGSQFCTNDAILVGQAQRFYQVVRTNAPPP